MTVVSPGVILERERDAIRAALAARGVERAGVFGSVTRGEDTADSDLDVIVPSVPAHDETSSASATNSPR